MDMYKLITCVNPHGGAGGGGGGGAGQRPAHSGTEGLDVRVGPEVWHVCACVCACECACADGVRV